MEIVILYSWENGNKYANEWAMALCSELTAYEKLHATCDMLWSPKSNVKINIRKNIENADKIIVIVTKDYNKKISKGVGMVSYEEIIYKDIIQKCENTNKILFVLKDKNVSLPKGWEDYHRIDLSAANIDDFANQKGIICENIENIVRFLMDKPEYIVAINKQKKVPDSKKARTFEELFLDISRDTNDIEDIEESLEMQESRLIEYIDNNSNQVSFVYEYVKSGLSSDTNLNGRITPQLFIKHFFVERQDDEESNYKKTIRELFASSNHNMLCIQSDGGSGKSVFLRTIAFRYAEQQIRNKYSNIIFDFSNIYDKTITKEDILYQKFKKIYRKIIKDTVPNWKDNFTIKLKKLREMEFPCTDLMFRLNEFEKELKKALESLIPSDNLDDWYNGFSNRLSKIKKQTDKNILFVILMTFYLFALESKPSINKEERYVIIFDNIETFDNGNKTREISEYVQKCYSFIQQIYGELNNKDAFYNKFTFVISMRTSTFLPFGNKQTNMWGGERFIKRIRFYDFTIDALIKKLIFLKNISNYKNTILYKTLYNVLSIIVSSDYINKALENTPGSNQDNYFATYRYLPLFNNNYRRAMEYICDAFTSELTSEKYANMLKVLLNCKSGEDDYDYLINGIRMMIIRHIFDELHTNGYLNTIGFPNLSGTEEYSMTRMMLEYLYWCEINYYLNNPQLEFKGVSIIELIWVFKHYCRDEKLIAATLYDLSIYVKRNINKANALYAWAYLIYYDKLDADLSADDFNELISNVYKGSYGSFYIDGVSINPKDIKVKLSDAGMCFVQHYLRNSEFLMARNNEVQGALFSLENKDDIFKYTEKIYFIIKNCIKKMINGGKSVCKLFGKEKDKCIYETQENIFDVMQCSLFIRCQECFDLIREAIDYIDRFRVSHCKRTNDNEINTLLLNQINKFYNLYEDIKDDFFKNSCVGSIQEFMKIWDGQFYEKCVKQLSTCTNKRIEKFRQIKQYYVNDSENLNKTIKELINKEKFTTSIYEEENSVKLD